MPATPTNKGWINRVAAISRPKGAKKLKFGALTRDRKLQSAKGSAEFLRLWWMYALRKISKLQLFCSFWSRDRCDPINSPLISGGRRHFRSKRWMFTRWSLEILLESCVHKTNHMDRFWPSVRSSNFNFPAPFDLEIAATLLIHPLLVGVAGVSRAKGECLQGEIWRSYQRSTQL